MLQILIYKEFKNILLSPKFTGTFLITSLLILLSVFIGINEYQTAMDQYEAGQQLAGQQLRETRSWGSAGTTVFRKPNPMQIFVNGVNNDIGRFSDIGDNSLVKLQNSMYADDPIFAIFRTIDLAFIFQVVLSLLAILFTYNAINGERESGTLKLVLSNTVPRARYLAAKVSGSWLGLIVPLFIPVLLSVLLILVLNVPMEGYWLRFCLFLLAGILYLSFFVCFGLLVSALTRSSATSFLFLLVFWIFSVLILPQIGTIAAGQLIPAPGQAELESQIEQFENDQWALHEDYLRKKWQERNALTEGMSSEERSAFQDEKMWGWMEEDDVQRNAMEEKINTYKRRAREEMLNKKQRQENLGLNLARISPASIFFIAAMNIADTDIHNKSRSENKMEDYNQIFTDFAQKKQQEGDQQSGGIRITMDSELGMNIQVSDLKKTIDVSEMPRFNDKSRSLSVVIAQTVIDFGLLSLITILAFAAAFISFAKYDVR